MTASAKWLKCRWRDPVCTVMDEAAGERQKETNTDRYRQRQTERAGGALNSARAATEGLVTDRPFLPAWLL